MMHRSVALLLTLMLIPAGSAFAIPLSADAVDTEFDPMTLDKTDALVPPGADFGLSLQATTARTGDYRIDALLSGSALSGTSVTYSFYEDDVFGGAYYDKTTETDVREVSDATKRNVRSILTWYGSVINVTFTEVVETSNSIGLLRFMTSAAPEYAYAYYPSATSMVSVASDVHLNPAYDVPQDDSSTISYNSFQGGPGTHGYSALIHEIGHAIGLKHPFFESQNPAAIVLPTPEDNTSHTVMSYTKTGAFCATAMPYDVMALQHMYGARSASIGDDLYKFSAGGTGQYVVGGVLRFSESSKVKQTIWDAGGIDTLDLSSLAANASGYIVDLGGGGRIVSTAEDKGSWYNFGSTLAIGATIENVISSSSADRIIANAANNTFGGYTSLRKVGADRIEGASASDIVNLEDYRLAGVQQTRLGNDLVLTLGTMGSITIADYYAGCAPQIVYGTKNQAPIAAFTAVQADRSAPYPVQFDAAASVDPDGLLVSWLWEFGDDTEGSGPRPLHAYAAAGTYTVQLTVTDAEGVSGQVQMAVLVSDGLCVECIAGSDRILTSISACQKAFPEGAENVVLATGENWPDALGGAALAGALGGPILLTKTAMLPTEIGAEIRRLGAKQVYVLGGTGAVSMAVAKAAAAIPGVTVKRIEGRDRYETARKVAEKTIEIKGAAYDGTAFIATGANFPDALGASPLAAAKGWPIYLSNPGLGDNATLIADMKTKGVRNVLLLGGTGVVSSAIENRVLNTLRKPRRLSGGDRYQTAIAVATYGVTDAGLGWDKLAIATGTNFPDALAGGVLQGRDGSVMLLTPGARLNDRVSATLTAKAGVISEVRFLGGIAGLSQSVRDAASQALE